MAVVASGTLVLARGEDLAVHAGPVVYNFHELPTSATHDDSVNVSVNLDIPGGMTLYSTGQYRCADTVFRHRFAFQSTGQAGVTIVHYTVTAE